MALAGRRPSHVEGYGRAKWVVLDFFDIVVHVFTPDMREFYGLERLWGDADRLELEDEENGSLSSGRHYDVVRGLPRSSRGAQERCRRDSGRAPRAPTPGVRRRARASAVRAHVRGVLVGHRLPLPATLRRLRYSTAVMAHRVVRNGPVSAMPAAPRRGRSGCGGWPVQRLSARPRTRAEVRRPPFAGAAARSAHGRRRASSDRWRGLRDSCSAAPDPAT